MSGNKNLHAANKAKNDEFYTQLTDIEKELAAYKEHFKDKVVFCNCDDPEYSNFWKYFSLKFDHLGLRKLIATHYETEKASYKLEMYRDEAGVHTEIKTLKQNGDFRSPECIELLQEADTVVTNPPFSLFREYVAQLIEYNKKFLIIGNINAITYKEVFPLIKNNKMWMGNTCFTGGAAYFMGDASLYDAKKMSNPKHAYMKEGVLYWRVNGVRWFTNLDNQKRHENIILYKTYNETDYPKYDNYDAINVDKVANIPCDYDGVMGVPISFLDKYNPDQFELVSFRKGVDNKDLTFTRKREKEFNHTFASLSDEDRRAYEQSERYQSQWQKQICKNSNPKKIEPVDLVFPSSTNLCGVIKNAEGKINGKATYARILIRRKE